MKERIFDWIGGSGIIISLIIAIVVALYTFVTPRPGFPFSSYDIRWAVIYAASFLIVLALFRHKSGSTLIVTVVIATALLLLLPLISSATRWSILTWFVLIYLFAALGAQILSWFFPISKIPLIDRWLVSLATGLAGMAMLTFVMGLLGVYYRLVAWIVVVVLCTLTWPAWFKNLGKPTLQWLRSFKSSLGSQNRSWEALSLGFLFICLWGTYIWALAPAIRYDALSYHLAAPAIYIRNHAIVQIPESFNTYWTHYADMLYTLAMLLVGQPLTGLLHFSSALISAGFVFALTRRLGSRYSAWVAALVFCSIPIISIQAGVAYIDLFTTLFVGGAIYAGIGWYQTKPENHSAGARWLVLCGGFAGLAVGTKLAALPVLIPFAILLGVAIVYRYPGKETLQGLAWLALPAFLLAAPWLLRDWIWTGNPIYPIMDSLFRSGAPTSVVPSAQSDLFAIAPLKRSSLLEYLLLPWFLTTNAARYYLETPGGALAGVPLLALPWSYWRRRHFGLDRPVNWLPVLLWLACLVGSILTFFSAANIRYLIPILAVLSSLVASNVDYFLPKMKTWPRFAILFIFGLCICYLYSTRLVTLSHIPQYMPRYPVAVSLGFADRQKFLSDQVMAYDAMQYLNQHAPDAKVLSLGNEFRLYTTTWINGTIFSNEARQILTGNSDPTELAKRLASAGYQYILINEPEMATSPLYAAGKVVTPEFLDRYARLVFTQNQVDVYQFVPQGIVTAAATENLLQNSGFEIADGESMPLYWEITGEPLYDRSGVNAHSGQAAVRVHGAAPGSQANPGPAYSFLSQDVPIQPGQIYTAAYWARPDQENGQGYVALQVNWLDDRHNLIEPMGVWKMFNPGWSHYFMHLQPPENAAYARFLVLVGGDQAGWFDDVCFTSGDGCR